MGQFHFGVGRGRIPAAIRAKIDKIAAKHGVDFTNPDLPGDGYRYWFSGQNDGYRYWFSGQNFGHPFDDTLAREVHSDLDLAGIDLCKVAKR